MRLWHYKLIPYLPTKQLLGQWSELNSIFKKQDKHILINYVYDYPKAYLWEYSMRVIIEMQNRNHKIKNLLNASKYFDKPIIIPKKIKNLAIFEEHNDEYLTICVWNLREKYIRGQKDFTDDVWNKIAIFYNNYQNLNIY